MNTLITTIQLKRILPTSQGPSMWPSPHILATIPPKREPLFSFNHYDCLGTTLIAQGNKLNPAWVKLKTTDFGWSLRLLTIPSSIGLPFNLKVLIMDQKLKDRE